MADQLKFISFFAGTVPHSGHRSGVARRSYPHARHQPIRFRVRNTAVARQRTITLAQTNSTMGYNSYLPAAIPRALSTAPAMPSTAARVIVNVTKYRTDLESESHEDRGRVGLNKYFIGRNFTREGHPNPRSTKTRSGPHQLPPGEKARPKKNRQATCANSGRPRHIRARKAGRHENRYRKKS
jgi:hypothetical protein